MGRAQGASAAATAAVRRQTGGFETVFGGRRGGGHNGTWLEADADASAPMRELIDRHEAQMALGQFAETVAVLRAHHHQPYELPRLHELRGVFHRCLHLHTERAFAAEQARLFELFAQDPHLTKGERRGLAIAVAKRAEQLLMEEPRWAGGETPLRPVTAEEMLVGAAQASYSRELAKMLAARLSNDEARAEQGLRSALGEEPYTRLAEEAAGAWGMEVTLKELFHPTVLYARDDLHTVALAPVLERKHWREFLAQEFEESRAYKLPTCSATWWSGGQLRPVGARKDGLNGELRYRLARLVRKRSRRLPGPRPLHADAR